jgi:hypothetical protein
MSLTSALQLSLLKQVDFLSHQLRDTVARPFELDRDAGQQRSTSTRVRQAPVQVQPPAIAGPVSHYEWIIALLRANPEGLTSKQILDYLERKVVSDAKSVRRVLSSAITSLRKQGSIELVGLLYSLPADSGR